jgi:hypothetical protein
VSSPDALKSRLALGTNPKFPGYPEDLRRRAEAVLACESLVEAVLYGHLLLEQALEILIDEHFKRPGVLENGRFARLSFAQKVTIYVGLYDPEDEQIRRLEEGFNRLRNRMAHGLVDLEPEVLRIFPDPKESATGAWSAVQRVRFNFFYLAMAELGVIHSARLVDPRQWSFKVSQNDDQVSEEPAPEG